MFLAQFYYFSSFNILITHLDRKCFDFKKNKCSFMKGSWGITADVSNDSFYQMIKIHVIKTQ